MKRYIALILVLILVNTPFASADTYTLEEILPSLSTFADDELAALVEAAVNEQESRNTDNNAESVAGGTLESEDQTPITEREDYIERASIQRGDRGAEAQAIQERLIELGFLVGTADGDFGKKSESAVKVFQKANNLEETGVADSITQYVMYSEMVLDKEAYNNMPIAIGDGWEIIKDYKYKTSWYNYYIFILKNTSGYNAEISANIMFHDADNNIIGVASSNERACENGHLTYWSFSNDTDFDHVSVEITMAEESRFKDGGQSCIEISTNIVGKKVIISARNTGKETVEYLEYHVIFLNENGEIASTDWGYLTDSDSQLKPGATEMREASYSKGFSDAQVYALGRIR